MQGLDLTALASSIVPLIEKLGVIGLLLVAMYFLIRELLRLRAELNKCYKQRDAARYAVVRYKTVCDSLIPPVKVDLSDIEDLLKEDT